MKRIKISPATKNKLVEISVWLLLIFLMTLAAFLFLWAGLGETEEFCPPERSLTVRALSLAGSVGIFLLIRHWVRWARKD